MLKIIDIKLNTEWGVFLSVWKRVTLFRLTQSLLHAIHNLQMKILCCILVAEGNKHTVSDGPGLLSNTTPETLSVRSDNVRRFTNTSQQGRQTPRVHSFSFCTRSHSRCIVCGRGWLSCHGYCGYKSREGTWRRWTGRGSAWEGRGSLLLPGSHSCCNIPFPSDCFL